MRLRRSEVRGPGLRRVRRGRGFSYQDPYGAPVTDTETLQRIKDLVIPPAWKKVWISSDPNGHIQAVGTDAAGRRQHLYHQQWQDERNEEKFDRALDMSAALPDMRAQIASDLRSRGLDPRPSPGAGAAVCSTSAISGRPSEQYAEENSSFGLATFPCEHVTLEQDAVEFDYPAKSGVRRTLLLDDPQAVRAVRCAASPPDRGDRSPACRNGSGWTDVHADDLNARFKEPLGDDYTVKDLRTWHGTVLAAEAFADEDPPVNKKAVKRVEAAVMREVAEGLGNTPAIARCPTSIPGSLRVMSRASPSRRGFGGPRGRGIRRNVKPSWTRARTRMIRKVAKSYSRHDPGSASNEARTATYFGSEAEGLLTVVPRQRRATRRCPSPPTPPNNKRAFRPRPTGAGQAADADGSSWTATDGRV